MKCRRLLIVLPLAQAAVETIKERPSSAVIASRVQAIARSRMFQTKIGDAIAGRYLEKTSPADGTTVRPHTHGSRRCKTARLAVQISNAAAAIEPHTQPRAAR